MEWSNLTGPQIILKLEDRLYYYHKSTVLIVPFYMPGKTMLENMDNAVGSFLYTVFVLEHSNQSYETQPSVIYNCLK